MTSRPPVVIAEGYVNPGQTAKIRVLNVFSGYDGKVTIASTAFDGGMDKPYELALVTDDKSGTSKSAVGQIPVAADVNPGQAETRLEFPGWNIIQNHKVIVDETSPTDPLVIELVKVDDIGMFNLRVTPISRNDGVCEAATDIPAASGQGPKKRDLNSWFGLIHYPGEDKAHNNITVDANKPGTYTVRVRQRFYPYDGTNEVVRDGQVVIEPKPPKPIPGGDPFIINHPIRLDRLGTKGYVKHKVLFGEDHEQPNTSYGLAVVPSVVPKSGSEGDLTPDAIAAIRDLTPFKYSRGADGVSFYSGNPSFFHNNDNYKVMWLVTVTPTREDVNASGGEG